MQNFKFTIEYDGTNFNGWQIQEKSQRTVQGEIQKVLEKIFKKKIHVHGSGRTDRGVHALGQVAHCQIETNKSTSEILFAVNANLPPDISIVKVEAVAHSFNAQYSALSKTYRYTILNRRVRQPLSRFFMYQYPYRLDIAGMKKAGRYLRGKNDFKAFTSLESARIQEGKARRTIRTVSKLRIKKSGPMIMIEIKADGFLYKMVRNIIGALLEVGSGRMKASEMKEILEKKDRAHAGKAAPPWGLCLLKVDYPK